LEIYWDWLSVSLDTLSSQVTMAFSEMLTDNVGLRQLVGVPNWAQVKVPIY
jgi:hypothetical protein